MDLPQKVGNKSKSSMVAPGGVPRRHGAQAWVPLNVPRFFSQMLPPIELSKRLHPRTYVAAFSGDQGPAEDTWIQSPMGRRWRINRTGRPMAVGYTRSPIGTDPNASGHILWTRKPRHPQGRRWLLFTRTAPASRFAMPISSRKIFPWRATRCVFNQGEITRQHLCDGDSLTTKTNAVTRFRTRVMVTRDLSAVVRGRARPSPAATLV